MYSLALSTVSDNQTRSNQKIQRWSHKILQNAGFSGNTPVLCQQCRERKLVGRNTISVIPKCTDRASACVERGLLCKISCRQGTIVKTDEGAKIMEGLRLFLVFIVGTSSGVIENFAYVRMREVGDAGKEMGLSRLVSSADGAPMFWFSDPLTERLGAHRVIVLALALASYVTRFYLYKAMRNPYHGLPAEALWGVTFAAFWSTGTIYAHRIRPPGMSTTMVSQRECASSSHSSLALLILNFSVSAHVFKCNVWWVGSVCGCHRRRQTSAYV